MDAKSGLCNLHVTNAETNFLFLEYRSNATSPADRTSEWKGRVARVAITNPQLELYTGSRSKFLLIDPTKQVIDNLHALFAKFDLDQNTTALLGEVKVLLKDTRFAEFPTYLLVKKWQSADGNFTDNDAQDMCEKLKGVWPGLRRVISPARLLSLRQAPISPEQWLLTMPSSILIFPRPDSTQCLMLSRLWQHALKTHTS